MTTLYENDVMPIGPHQGKTIKQVAEEAPQALISFQSTNGKFCVSDEVMDNLQNYKRKKITPRHDAPLGTDSAGEE